MNLLAFDTSTETMSVAVSRIADGQPRLWEYSGAGGPRASAMLIPTVLDLLAQAGLQMKELDAIAFGRGPGSFTGVRTACSVAQGLAYGAGVKVLQVDTLLAVAQDARHKHGVTRVVAALDARMDEIYAGWFEFEGGLWRRPDDFELLRPEALQVAQGWALAGNVAGPYGARLAQGVPCLPALPTAAAMIGLCPSLLAAGEAVDAALALPRYVRDKVAKTTAERAAERIA